MSPKSRAYLYLAITVILITVSEIFLKLGAVATAPAGGHDWLGLSSLASEQVWIGTVLLIVSSITWILVLRILPLYLAFTICSIIHVTIPICSWIILHDRINPLRGLGISLVLVGIWVIARPASRIEERPQ